MRKDVDDSGVRAFLKEFGRRCRGPGSVYLVGGATAVLRGFRTTTVDVDLVLDPEPAGAFEAIAQLKDELDVNVELSSPAHFLPELPDWRERSPRLGVFGSLEVFDYDLRAQAMAKLSRSFERDLHDVHAMLAAAAISKDDLRAAFAAMQPRLNRFPRVDPEILRARVEALPETNGS